MIVNDASQSLDEGEYIEEQRERIWVTVRRDESHADGGITSPRVGDVLRYPNDNDTAAYSYQGEVRYAESPGVWDLLFARNRPAVLGPRG